MSDKPRTPRPLGWCSRCLAQGHVEQPAVTMNRGTGLCRACNAAVSAGSPSSALLGDVASEAQALLEVGLDGVRGIARTLGSRPPR